MKKTWKKSDPLPYREGDWFAVPLRGGGYALGIAARLNGEGKVLGYFFGPKREEIPVLADAVSLSPEQAIHVRFFGDLGLLDGTWPILGRLDTWQRSVWRMPAFGRYFPELKTPPFRIEYEDDTLRQIGETKITPEECQKLPRDGSSGFGAIEITLTKRLSGEKVSELKQAKTGVGKTGVGVK